jgi:hopanoid biosynthesis associated RND transporter like protein HpnN
MNVATATRAYLPRLVGFCSRRPLIVLAIALLAAGLSLFAAQQRLGVTTDTGGMFAANLPWKQASDALAAAFPQNDNLLVAVIDAQIPEEADVTAAALTVKLQADTTHFLSVTNPDALPYLQKNAFLLIDKKPLQDLLERTIDAQPFLGQLAADPSLRGLFSALGLVVEGAARHQADAASLAPSLEAFHRSLAAAAAGHARPLSWQNLLAGPLAAQAGKYRFVLARPKLDYSALQPGGGATQALRAAAAGLPYIATHEARLRVTGSVALDDEEFATVVQGATYGLIGSFLLVILWLFLATRSWRLVVPILATLLLGLTLTTGFAALAVGTLNLISVAFAILFVGIAVDFSIQFSVRLRERRRAHPMMLEAVRETGRRAGAQILVASLATASGFLAFTPTDFVGVAQLGTIAGGGMLIAFVCTLTFLPAMISLFHPPEEPRDVGPPPLRRLDPFIVRIHRPVLAVFLLLALLGVILTPLIKFDGDPLHTKNQHTEAVETLYDLMGDPLTNPYTIEVLRPSLADAVASARRLDDVKLVQDVLTLDSFVPQDQAAKLALIQDAAGILGVTLAPPASAPPYDAAALRRAAVSLDAALTQILPQLAPADPLRAIAADLSRLSAAPDATLLAANDALTRFLPLQLDRLRTALTAAPVTLADVPAGLKRDWVLPDGRARLQVLPSASVQNTAAIRQFVANVTQRLPDASGSAVWIVQSTATITGAFRIAAMSAVAAIAVILAVALRRPLDVLLVMAPLMVSAFLTVLLFSACGLSLNFANIIALPLLLGVGVSFNIYFVMNWRAGNTRFLGSATARAVMFSALTTGTAFGSLALSAHPGTASMGTLLLMSLFCTVVTTLLFVPALLAVVPRPHVLLGGVKEEKLAA